MHTSPDSEPRTDGAQSTPPDGADAQQGQRSSSGGDFFSWLRGLGIVRGGDRWFAGVAGGIAARAGIDPLIVRGVFVVLAILGGPGLLLYLVGWLLLPDAEGRIHVEEIIKGRASGGVLATAIVIVCVVVLPAVLGLLFGGSPFVIAPGFWGWDLWGALGIPEWLIRTTAWLFWIAVAVAGFFWVRKIVLDHGRNAQTSAGADRSEAHSGAAPGAAPGPTPSAAPGPAPGTSRNTAPGTGARADFDAFAQRTSEQAAQWGQQVGEKAAQWGDDVGKRADEWSAKYAEHHDAHKIGAAQTILTLALALLAAGLTAVYALLVVGATGIGGIIVACLIAALAVLALSMMVAGLRGRHTGTIGFLAFCGVVALLFTSILPLGTRVQPFGNAYLDGSGSPGVVIVAGNAHVDLRDLDATDAGAVDGSSTRSAEPIEVWLLAGNSEVLLPSTHPTVVRVQVLAGNIEEHDGGFEPRAMRGPFLGRTVAANLPTGLDAETAVASGRATEVTIRLLAGNATITHGEEPGADGASDDAAVGERTAPAPSGQVDRTEELRDLRSELELAEWRLQEPGLDGADRLQLRVEIDAIRANIADLEKEMNR